MRGRLTDPDVLRALIAERDLTVAELAAASGVSDSLIRYVLSGERQFSDHTAHLIASALSCKPTDFSRARPMRRRNPGEAAA